MSRLQQLAAVAMVAFGASIPLWIRQYHHERYVERQVRDYTAQANREIEDVLRRWKRWGDDLVRQVKGAV